MIQDVNFLVGHSEWHVTVQKPKVLINGHKHDKRLEMLQHFSLYSCFMSISSFLFFLILVFSVQHPTSYRKSGVGHQPRGVRLWSAFSLCWYCSHLPLHPSSQRSCDWMSQRLEFVYCICWQTHSKLSERLLLYYYYYFFYISNTRALCLLGCM